MPLSDLHEVTLNQQLPRCYILLIDSHIYEIPCMHVCDFIQIACECVCMMYVYTYVEQYVCACVYKNYNPYFKSQTCANTIVKVLKY